MKWVIPVRPADYSRKWIKKFAFLPRQFGHYGIWLQFYYRELQYIEYFWAPNAEWITRREQLSPPDHPLNSVIPPERSHEFQRCTHKN